MRYSFIAIATAAFLAIAAIKPAQAQKTAPDRCLALAQMAPQPALIHKARFQRVALKPYQVRVTYVGHSTFAIESPKGVAIATDYNDHYRPTAVPTIATMNIAHSTHHSYAPDERIKHVLRGWNPAGKGAAMIHDLNVLDVRVRNVPTNIRTSFGGPADGRFGNSIFVFEIGGLCIAHLGHLHHTLTVQQLTQIGQMDVVFVPVDGTYTLDTAGMVEVMKSMKARIVIPMHYFSGFSLNHFIEATKGSFEVVTNPSSTIVISKDQIPTKPRLLILPPGTSPVGIE